MSKEELTKELYAVMYDDELTKEWSYLVNTGLYLHRNNYPQETIEDNKMNLSICEDELKRRKISMTATTYTR